MYDIIFDQSARSIFARCQPLVAACDFDFPSFASLLGVLALVFARVEVQFILKWRQVGLSTSEMSLSLY